MAREGEITIRDAQITQRNFAGNPERNYDGKSTKRSFSVIIDPENAQNLADLGWNVKTSKRSENAPDDWEPRYFLQVTVSFSPFPPKVKLIMGEKVLNLEEKDVASLDSEDLSRVDLVIAPYSSWNTEGRITAYLKQGHFFAETSELDVELDAYLQRNRKTVE